MEDDAAAVAATGETGNNDGDRMEEVASMDDHDEDDVAPIAGGGGDNQEGVMDEDEEEAVSAMETASSTNSANSGPAGMATDNDETASGVLMEDAVVVAVPTSGSDDKNKNDSMEDTDANANSLNDDDEAMDERQQDNVVKLQEMEQEKNEEKTASSDADGDDTHKTTSVARAEVVREQPQSTNKMTKMPPPDLSLHDWLSLGEIELGLNSCHRDKINQEGGPGSCLEEIERLPFLLRTLNKTRPMADIPVAGDDDGDGDGDDKAASDVVGGDTLLNRVVDRLEDVAATYSAAEGIDVVGNYLAPALCKKISRLAVPLSKRPKDDQQSSKDQDDDDDQEDFGSGDYYYDNVWDTRGLEEVARDPISRSFKRKRSDGDATKSTNKQDASMTEQVSSDGDDDEEEETTVDVSDLASPISKRSLRRDSVEVAGEDSQESTVLKTLSEVTALVVASLRPINNANHDSEHDPNQQDTEEAREQSTGAGESHGSTLALTVEDSILSEAGKRIEEGATSGVKSTTLHGNDLGSTMACIMHQSPVLQSRHVAMAFCRASLPQTGCLLTRIAANCPATVPGLLLGCTDAYKMAREAGNGSIIKTAKEGTVALANLSKNDAVGVQTKLQMLDTMYDVQLRLCLEMDSLVQVAATLVQQLPSLVSCINMKDATLGQPPGDVTSAEAAKTFYGFECKDKEPSLLYDLIHQPDLLAETLQLFHKHFRRAGEIIESGGKWCLTMQSFCLLLLVPAKLPDPFLLLDSFNVVIGQLNVTNDEMVQHESSNTDSLLVLLTAASVLLVARVLTETDVNDHMKNRILSLIGTVRRTRVSSKQMTKQWKCIDHLVENGCIRGLFNLVLTLAATQSEMRISGEETSSNQSYQFLQVGLKRLCDLVRPTFNKSSHLGMSATISALRYMLREIHDGGPIPEDALDVLKSLVHDTACDVTPHSMAETVEFVAEATKTLSKGGLLAVPLVMQPELDHAWSKVEYRTVEGGIDEEALTVNECIYLLRLLHAFEFLDEHPFSPFSIDPRSLPLKMSLQMAGRLPPGATRVFLTEELGRLAAQHCPEIETQAFDYPSKDRNLTLLSSSMSRGDLMATLQNVIQSSIREGFATICEARDAERLFAGSKRSLCDADLYCTIVSACLSSPFEPPPVFTYHVLCGDPMIVFKFPVHVWRSKGLRRIALNTLWTLLRANERIILEKKRPGETAEELLAARDAIVVRCLLAALNKTESASSSIVCPMTTSFIRWLVANRFGLVAIILKQGLEEKDLDWLVENVPETMNDSRALMDILSERNGLTAAERIVAADGIIRVAILHGNLNAQDAAKMTVAALSKLVDSFYLILGPVGEVPVNSVLALDDAGADTIQVSRAAAFRILKALTRVQGRRTSMKKEVGTALQKLANLCKGESVGTGRRNNLLKEIFDACVKAASIMGVSLGSQGVVA